MDDPSAVGLAAKEAVLTEFFERRRDGRALGADDPPEHLMGERQRYGDTVRRDRAPAIGELPEQQDEAHVEPRLVEDRQVADEPA